MKRQHTSPCRECPWRRISARGWLGPETGYPEVYIAAAHGEEIIECHMSHVHECAGAAIYRANVSKKTKGFTLCEDCKLQANRAAIERWMTKHRLASNKLHKLFAKDKRLQAAQAEQNKPSGNGSPFARKFV